MRKMLIAGAIMFAITAVWAADSKCCCKDACKCNECKCSDKCCKKDGCTKDCPCKK